MDVGNKTHAAILTVAAVGAIGWMGMRMIPHRPGIALNDHVGTPVRLAAVPDLPQDVTRDAFSHPALYRPAKNGSGPGVTDQNGERENSVGSSELSGQLGGTVAALDTGEAKPLLAPAPPGDIAGKGQQPKKETSATLSLRAVMRASKPIAMIEVTSDKNPTVQTYSVGQTVRGGYTVQSIGPNSVVLTAKRKPVITLLVGAPGVETK